MISFYRRITLIVCISFLSVFYIEAFITADKFDFQSRMDFYNIPGVSISVVDGGKLLWSDHYGEGVSKETLFQAGTMTKAITSIAVLKLVEEGILDLDTDINSYLKEWDLGKEIYTKRTKITLRHLLSHTSGIHSHGLKGYGRDEEFPELVDILNGNGNSPKVSAHYFPGLKFRYAWGGFIVMQKVIEDTTGVSFSEYMNKNILQPLGMMNSTFNLTDDFNVKATPGHDLFGNNIEGEWRHYPELAAMGLWSTTEDIAKYCIEIEKILTEDYEGILSREAVIEYLDEYKSNWGLGVSVKFKEQALVFRHRGKSLGYTSYFASRPYKKQAIIIMTNSDNA